MQCQLHFICFYHAKSLSLAPLTSTFHLTLSSYCPSIPSMVFPWSSTSDIGSRYLLHQTPFLLSPNVLRPLPNSLVCSIRLLSHSPSSSSLLPSFSLDPFVLLHKILFRYLNSSIFKIFLSAANTFQVLVSYRLLAPIFSHLTLSWHSFKMIQT